MKSYADIFQKTCQSRLIVYSTYKLYIFSEKLYFIFLYDLLNIYNFDWYLVFFFVMDVKCNECIFQCFEIHFPSNRLRAVEHCRTTDDTEKRRETEEQKQKK